MTGGSGEGKGATAMGGPEIVTLLFTDLVGSTQLLEQLGEEAAEELRRVHFGLLRDAVSAHGGSEVKNLGDGLMAVFGSAVDGVTCAVAIQQRVAAHNRAGAGPTLSVRVGLHLGEPIRSENDYFGTAVVVARRLCDVAHGGQILASQLVADLLGSRRAFRFTSVGTVRLKGLADPLAAFEIDVEGAAAPGGRPSTAAAGGDPSTAVASGGRPPMAAASPGLSAPLDCRPDPPLSGREAERTTLDSEVGWSAAGQFRCWLLTGDPGAGKTALAGEVLGRHRRDLLVLTARAHGFDEAEPYALWARALDRHLRGLEAEEVLELCGPYLDDLAGSLRSAAALRGSVDVPAAPAPARLLDGLTSLFANLAARAPVAVFLDDAHRADDSCWEALHHFAHQLVDDRVFVLVAARSRELADRAAAGEVIGRLEADGLLRGMALSVADPSAEPSAEATTDDGSSAARTDPAALIGAARQAMGAGDAAGAIAALTAALAIADIPAAHQFLGGLYYATEDLPGCRQHWEAAFRGFRDAGDLRGAAKSALDLGILHYSGFGHEVVGHGWLGRARRLVEQIGRCVELGYLELALVACDIRDAGALEASAALALELAVEFGDPALEARALADSGLALITQGRVAEGFARLDEAMVPITTGELADPVITGKIFCALLTACERTGDVRRAEEWSALCQELVLEPMDGLLPVLHAHCRITYGAVLCRVGRWPEAETEILRALGPCGSRFVSKRAEAIGRLAELRIRQGRLEEAAELLRPVEDRFEVVETLAELHVARGEWALAAAVINRTLAELVEDRLRAGPLLALLTEVELARDDLEAAEATAARLAGCAEQAESPVLRAHAARAAGLVAARQGDAVAAATRFEEAQRELAQQEQPVLRAALRLETAEVLAAAGDTAAAVAEARAALAAFERLGAARDADRAAACLRGLGVAGRRARSRDRAAALGELSSREREVLDLLGEGLTNAEIARRLYITPKTAEHHVGR
ncbi:MAG: AAA family ATPase, partial [Actinobacteria bacterium]|nr:AAA family ATPase [Actinomycetota bacterium]